MARALVSIVVCLAACAGGEKPRATPPVLAASAPATATVAPPEQVAEAFMTGLQNADMDALWDAMNDEARASVAKSVRGYVDGLFPGCARTLHQDDRTTLAGLSDRDLAVRVATTNLEPTAWTWTVDDVTMNDANTATAHITADDQRCELEMKQVDAEWRTTDTLQCPSVAGIVGIAIYRVHANDRMDLYRIETTQEGFAAHGVLLPGDVILSVDGTPVTFGRRPTLSELVTASGGNQMRIVVLRDFDKRIEVDVVADAMPNSKYRLGIGLNTATRCELQN
jgi:hypothetical protein